MKKHRIGIYTNPSVSYADSSLEKGAYEMLTSPLDKGSAENASLVKGG